MLTYISGEDEIALPFDDYCICHKWNGLDELEFSVPADSDFYTYIAEEKQVIETTEKQRYLTKAIDEGGSYAKIVCQIDVDDFKSKIFINYSNGSATVSSTVTQVLPAGWTVINNSGVNIRRTVELEGPTALDVIMRCAEVYGVCFRFDTNLKIVKIVNPDNYEPVGAFITEDLNLKELNYKGKSSDLITRIYAVGKDGLTFASINGGKSYVDDNRYTNKVISYYWKDDRYTDKASLLADAKKKLKVSSVPTQSYECAVIDLANTNPEMYGFLDFDLFTVATLISKRKKTSVNHQVVEVKNYPYYPELNEVTLSTVAPSIQSTVKNIQDSMTTPNSGFQQRMQALINTLGEQISGELGGNYLLTNNSNGKPNGFLIMDTDDISTAQKILRFNLSGISYTADGGNNYSSVWSFAQGGFIADWLVAGTINADLVHIVNLIADHVESSNGIYKMSVWAAVFSLMDGLNNRVKIYTTASIDGKTQGIVQVFAGTAMENGIKDDDYRYSYLTGPILGVGQKADGTYGGEVRAGDITLNGKMTVDNYVQSNIIQCNKLSVDGGAAQKVYWKWSATLGAYVLTTSTTIK